MLPDPLHLPAKARSICTGFGAFVIYSFIETRNFTPLRIENLSNFNCVQDEEGPLPPQAQRREKEHAGLSLALRAVEHLTGVLLEALAAAAAERAAPLTAALALRQLELLARPMPHTLWQIPAAGVLQQSPVTELQPLYYHET